MLLQNIIDLFVADVCAGKRNETPKTYKAKLKYFTLFVTPDIDVISLPIDIFEQFKNFLINRTQKRWGAETISEPLSLFTIKTVLTTTRHFLRWAHQNNYLPTNVTKSVTIPTPPHPHPKAITIDDVDRLLKAAAGHGPKVIRYRNLSIIYMLRDTGGRIGGLVNLDIQDLELERERAYVTEKGGKSRYLYMLPTTVLVLSEWLKHRHLLEPKDHRVFTSKYHRGLSRPGIYGLLRILAQKGKLQGRYNPHSFRHAFARDALKNGGDLSRVSRLLGHSSVAVTADYYACWADEELHEFHASVSPARNLKFISPSSD